MTGTRVDRNVAGAAIGGTSPASCAAGGGIENHPQGTLILRRSSVSENRAAVVAPNGAFTDGGGIADGGALTLESSVVAENVSMVTAAVPSYFPFDVEVEANAGGLYLRAGHRPRSEARGSAGTASSRPTPQATSRPRAAASTRTAGCFWIDSSVDSNTATGSVPADSGFLVEADGGGIQVQDLTTCATAASPTTA